MEADVGEQQMKTSTKRFVEDIVPTRLSSMKLGDQAPRKQILKYHNKKKSYISPGKVHGVCIKKPGIHLSTFSNGPG